LFGATSGKTGGVFYLRWGKGTYANVRPIRWRPGYNSPLRDPQGIDYVIVRENLEDLYAGLEGDASALGDLAQRSRTAVTDDSRYAIKIFTREGVERVTRFACNLAQQRRGKVTVSTKYNMLPRSDGWFLRIAEEIIRAAGLEFERFIVDDFARRLVASPHDLDVVLLPNLYGDILSDEGAGTIGGLGLVPSGCYGDTYAYFESVHGSAPDIAGQHIINPTATLLSAVLMLEHLGLNEAARRLDDAISRVYAAGDPAKLTRDQGGKASTEEFAATVVAALPR
jgi:isocitrate/isopropylmalate dehydrogenase